MRRQSIAILEASAALSVLVVACSSAPTPSEALGVTRSAVTSNPPPPGWPPPPANPPWAGDPEREAWQVSPYCDGLFVYADNDGTAYCSNQYGAGYGYGYCHTVGAIAAGQVSSYTPNEGQYCVCCPDWLTSSYQNTLSYRVLGLAYAPPGDASNVNYGSASLTGSQASLQTTSQVGGAIQLTSSVVTASASWVSGTVNGTTNQVVLQSGNGFGNNATPASGDAINHGNDLFAIWTTPRLVENVTWSNGTTNYTFENGPNSTVVLVHLSDLENPSQMSAGLQQLLSGLNAADFAAIMNLDPWYANPNFDPTTQPDRFLLTQPNQNLVISGPNTAGETMPQTTVALNNNTQDVIISGTQENTQSQVLVGGKVSFVAEGGIQGGVQFDYQYQKLHGSLTGTNYSANATLASATQCYTQVASAWLDTMFNTYAFTAGAPNTQCGTMAGAQQLRAEGIPVVAGYVHNSSGSWVPGAEVDLTIQGTTTQVVRGVAQSDGSFVFQNVPAGNVTAATSPSGAVTVTCSAQSCDAMYLDANDSPLQVVQGGSSGQANIVMVGSWVASDLGKGATGTVLSEPAGWTEHMGTGMTIDSGGAIPLTVAAPLTAAPGMYQSTVRVTDVASGVQLTATIPIQVLACVPDSASTVCSGGACGTYSAGCGVTVNCGSCASGEVCSNGYCCEAGYFYNVALNTCEPLSCPTGTSYCYALGACATYAACSKASSPPHCKPGTCS